MSSSPRQCYERRFVRFFATEKDTETRSGQDGNPSQSSKPSLTQNTIPTTRAKTKELTAKLKSSLTSLTPHENIYTLPNFLTASRLVAAPVIGYFVINGDLKWAMALFAYAGVTDLVDGWIARRWKLQTVVGSVIDPMADKTLMTVVTIALAWKGLLPAYLATLILGRDITLAVAAIYYRYASLPAPKTFSRYWDFSLPSAEVHPTTVSKYNTFLQLCLIGATLAMPVMLASPATSTGDNTGVLLYVMDTEKPMMAFQILVAATTTWSGLSYAYLKNAVTILGNDEKLKIKQGKRGRMIIGVGFGAVVMVAGWFAFRDQQQQQRLSTIDESDPRATAIDDEANNTAKSTK